MDDSVVGLGVEADGSAVGVGVEVDELAIGVGVLEAPETTVAV